MKMLPSRSMMLLLAGFILLCIALFYQANSAGVGYVIPTERIDCSPFPSIDSGKCAARGCIWDENYDKEKQIPACYFPSKSGGYELRQKQLDRNKNAALTLTRLSGRAKNPYGQDLPELNFVTKSIGSTLHLQIGTESRYTPPIPINTDEKTLNIWPPENLELKVLQNSPFAFAVQRADGAQIWDTSIGGLYFADQYIQIATFLPSDRVYGFGEHIHEALKHDFSKYKTWGMWARDQGPDSISPDQKNLYGVHPFYLALEASGKAHGVLFLNSNAQEVTTGPAPHITYRTIGGQLDIFFFPGPTPEQVIQQYQALIGRPYLPPYWALGYQFCRYGYKDLDDMKSTIKRIRDSDIPIDVAYADIDYMDHYQDFTYDQQKWREFPAYAEELHQQMGMKLVLIIDPAIDVTSDAFKNAIEQNASFIEWERKEQVPTDIQSLYPLVKDTMIMLGVVWPEHHAAFPDFLDPTNRTVDWWRNEIEMLHGKLPLDGIWIDMNEPSSFSTNEDHLIFNEEITPLPKQTRPNLSLKPLKCPSNGSDAIHDRPPYPTINAFQWSTRSLLSERSLCLLGRTQRGNDNLFNTHSLYGWSESVATHSAMHQLLGKRTQIVSRSTFPSSGAYASHWLGDNTSRWPDLRSSIIGIVEFNMFGIPHVGADVCGFSGATNEELCLRWQQLGAFYTFFRNHNADGQPPQDPPQWKSVALATKAANLFRYRYLPYLYSLHFRVHLEGGTVIRPLFFEFPREFPTHEISNEFLWGDGFLVVPVTEPNVSTVRGYLPFGAEWYSLSEANNYGTKVPLGFSEFQAPRDTPLPVFLRGGTIIPRQRPAMTTLESRRNEFELVAALSEADDDQQNATGFLYLDDGESFVHDYFHFKFSIAANANGGVLTVKRTTIGSSPNESFPTLDLVELFGLSQAPQPDSFTLNGRSISISSVYNSSTKCLKLSSPSWIRLDDPSQPIIEVRWQNAKQSKDNDRQRQTNSFGFLHTIVSMFRTVFGLFF